ncbi:histidine kinase [Maribellus sp. YY47]|uniref:sensor histidine kinase n=1 Tax=Maribellus sp. YY47 TaxID=2929486 RepID=UPI0020017612|nr:histidine kinase [Maribellus sp. YY47]MCK3684213.1 histidine kinase [Maribellus sp. YY47]
MKIFKYRVLNHILFWIAIFTFYTIPYLLSYGFVLEAFINLIYIPVDIVGVYFVIEFLIPRYVFKKRKLIIYFLGTVAVIALNILISQFIKYNIQPALGFWVMRRPLQTELFYALLNNFMIIGTATALKLFSYSYNIQLTKSELERKTVQSELGILRSQVNPHFLFNVLNNIDSLIFEDREKASNAIVLLSKIMRYMLQESTREEVNLEKEMEYIHDYLELAQLSFSSPDFVRFEMQGTAVGKEVPPLLFIPIIENAVKHCNKQSPVPGIEIEFKISDECIELRTSNYVKRNDFKLPDNGSGTGLKNVEKRLKLLHGDNFTFDINRNMDKFEVNIKVPIKRTLK